MKKRIWLINQYAMPPKYEVRIQTLKRAQYLIEKGHDVTIISGSFLHNTDINLIKDKSKFIRVTYDNIKFIHIRTSSYKGNGLSRFLNLFQFTCRFILLSKKFVKPDVIAQIATVPFGNLIYFVAKRFKAKYIVDVVDLWPESFVAFGLAGKNNPFIKFSYWAEKWLYKRADEVIFSMEGGKDYIIEKKWDKLNGGPIDLSKIHYINNGVDLHDFNLNKNTFKIENQHFEDSSIFKVVYLGSIRLVNNIKLLIDAANHLKYNDKIKILIYGDGGDREYLENYCKDNDIFNVHFMEKWVELKYVPYILSNASLNVLNYQQGSIFKYGGSQSKSFQYMASGKPIISNLQMGYCPIKKFNLGIAKEFKSSEEYANAILSIKNLTHEKYNELCNNAKNTAKLYDYKFLTDKFAELLK